jgi:hypothetical protein
MDVPALTQGIDVFMWNGDEQVEQSGAAIVQK